MKPELMGSVALRRLAKGMEEYIEYLKSRDPEIAKKEAQEALYRTGVIDKNGKTKKNIVNRF